MERSRTNAVGLTLVEVLIAIGILGLVMALVLGGVTGGLRVQRGQEAATATQARLRRVAEVFTQDVRSAVLGAVGNTPYTSGSSSVSFMLLDGGAGWLVSEIVPASNRIGVLGTAGLGSQGTQMMLVDAGGRAVVFTVSGMSTSGGTTNVTASGSGCFAGLQASAGDGNKNALLFRVKTLGLRYDGSDVLYQREGSGPELPLAFNLSDVGISYVYEGESGTLYTLNAPKLENGNPARNSVHNGEAVELRRLQIALAAEGRGLSSTVERRYVSQVEMASNPSFFIKVVTTCS